MEWILKPSFPNQTVEMNVDVQLQLFPEWYED